MTAQYNLTGEAAASAIIRDTAGRGRRGDEGTATKLPKATC